MKKRESYTLSKKYRNVLKSLYGKEYGYKQAIDDIEVEAYRCHVEPDVIAEEHGLNHVVAFKGIIPSSYNKPHKADLQGLTGDEYIKFRGMFKRAPKKDKIEASDIRISKKSAYKYLAGTVKSNWRNIKGAGGSKAPLPEQFKGKIEQKDLKMIAQKYNPFSPTEDYRGYNKYEQKISEFIAYKKSKYKRSSSEFNKMNRLDETKFKKEQEKLKKAYRKELKLKEKESSNYQVKDINKNLVITNE